MSFVSRVFTYLVLGYLVAKNARGTRRYLASRQHVEWRLWRGTCAESRRQACSTPPSGPCPRREHLCLCLCLPASACLPLLPICASDANPANFISLVSSSEFLPPTTTRALTTQLPSNPAHLTPRTSRLAPHASHLTPPSSDKQSSPPPQYDRPAIACSHTHPAAHPRFWSHATGTLLRPAEVACPNLPEPPRRKIPKKPSTTSKSSDHARACIFFATQRPRIALEPLHLPSHGIRPFDPRHLPPPPSPLARGHTPGRKTLHSSPSPWRRPRPSSRPCRPSLSL